MRHHKPFDLTLAAHATLPGEALVDLSLVARAVRHICALRIETVLDFHRGVGEHVLRTFFDDDPEEFRARGRSHRSYARLAEELHEHLGLAPSSLWFSIALVEQFRVLPDEIAASLPLSHHRILVHVQDLSSRRALAVEAVTEGLSKRELEHRILWGRRRAHR